MANSMKTTFDTYSKTDRSRLMGKISSKNTKPELIIRRALFRSGLRYRIHNKNLPGKPDISILKYNLIIDVRGCFWHGHQNCKNGHAPRTNSEFWKNKLQKNINRDSRNLEKLCNLGFKVFIIWECEISSRKGIDARLEMIYDYLNNDYNLNIKNNKKKGIKN